MKRSILVLLSCSIALLAGCSDLIAKSAPVESHPSSLALVNPITDCQALTQVDLTAIGGKGSQIQSAKQVVNQQGATVCEVHGMLAPTIGFTVQMPTQNWGQRFMQLGCGGLCGRIDLRVGAAEQCPMVQNSSMVLAASDMGHQGPSSDFGDIAQKRIDFAYRSVHVTALATKTLIKAYYGQAEKFAYFNGCSDGGREALMEAQRYPTDFNGIIAGAPAMNFSVQNSMHHGWLALANSDKNGQPILRAAQMPILHQAVLDQCDALDGQTDGLLRDPRQCHFNPQVLLCKAGQSQGCLSQAQIDAAKKIYAGPHDAKTGEALALGAPLPGSELAWIGVFVPQDGSNQIFSTMIAEGALQKVLFTHNPDHFTLSDLHFDSATFDQLRPLYGLYSAVDPNLRAFKQHGGKLILWHGWSDQHISPINSIAYFEAVKAEMGEAQMEQFMNFYLIPGMYHCFGGDGPSSFDLLTPLMSWVEQGQKPNAIVANQMNNIQADGAGAPQKSQSKKMPIKPQNVSIVRSRPVYPFPYVAQYNGNGDENQASNYHAVKGEEGTANYSWAGQEYYQPGKQLTCQAVNNQLQCQPRKETGL